MLVPFKNHLWCLSVISSALCVSLSLVSLASAEPITAQVVMSGLNNPRGIAIGKDGGIYVTEAGTGATGTGIESPPTVVGVNGETVAYGETGSVSRYLGGLQSRVLTGLPSLADPVGNGVAQPAGNSATGLQDIVFDSTGIAYGVIGSPGGPDQRTALNISAGGTGDSQGPGNLFGRLVRLNFGTTPSVDYLADFVPTEGADNPDGGDINSNPYGLTPLEGGGFGVIDAGANVLWNVSSDLSTLSLTSVFAPKPNPLFGTTGGGGPTYASVPTAVTLGPNGNYFVSELAGYPFKQGGADIYSIPAAGGAPTAVFTGFTTIIDLAFAPDGNLYVLQLTQNGLGPEATTGPGPGQLLRVNPITGEKTVLDVSLAADPGSLLFSTGMVFDTDGSLYVSNLGTSPGGGQVLRLTGVTVPEAGTGLLMLVAVSGGTGIVCRRKK